MSSIFSDQISCVKTKRTIEVSGFAQSFNFFFQTVRENYIILAQQFYEARTCEVNRVIPVIGWRNWLETINFCDTRIVEIFDYLYGVISRTIIRYDNFKVLKSLVQNTLYRLRNMLGAIMGRDANGDKRTFC
jgi:hypothetical protein